MHIPRFAIPLDSVSFSTPFGACVRTADFSAYVGLSNLHFLHHFAAKVTRRTNVGALGITRLVRRARNASQGPRLFHRNSLAGSLNEVTNSLGRRGRRFRTVLRFRREFFQLCESPLQIRCLDSAPLVTQKELRG